MLTRRSFLSSTLPVGAALTTFNAAALPRVLEAAVGADGRPADDIARDEAFWRDIQEEFTLDRTIVSLNNGGVCPSPRVVHEAFKRYLDIANQSPVYHMWQILEPNIESVRRELAREFGCDPEELAITRNASESLQIAQLGIDLKPGDEVLTTDCVFARWWTRGGIQGGRTFVVLSWLALAGCLFHARFDFPIQIHSTLFLFVLICAVLFTTSRRPVDGHAQL